MMVIVIVVVKEKGVSFQSSNHSLVSLLALASKTLNPRLPWSAFATSDSDILEHFLPLHQVHSTMLIVSSRARILWGHAPRVRSAAAFRRGLATVADHTDSR
jgi:hypothetical protein